jgi:hypothetical protein
MQVDDGVDPVLCTQVDCAVEVLQALLLEHAGRHVVLEVPVVDGEADAVEPERGEEGRVGVGEEVLEELGCEHVAS